MNSVFLCNHMLIEGFNEDLLDNLDSKKLKKGRKLIIIKKRKRINL
ncbi:Uncharacterised protein [Mycobacteroides abscessus subsp. abscessus]|nr:Uncharacterised protein [Mycobacteroides abscessus subsp. abscessus]